MKYFASLDGVRGLAILLVLSFHSSLNDFGWIGVELFFVLSGFLITRGLVQDTELSWQHYLKRFYTRRFLRIFPIYYLYIALIAVLALAFPGVVIFHPPARFLWFAALAYLTNYACLFSLFTVFNHFWSLALEEQFYLVWPYVVKGARRVLPAVALALIILCPLLRAIAPYVMAHLGVPVAQRLFYIYMLPIAHTDGFAVGALIAVTQRPWLRHPARWLAGSVLLLLLVGVAAQLSSLHGWQGYLRTFGYPGSLPLAHGWVYGYSLIFFTAGFLIVTVLEKNRITDLFSFSPLVYIGKISYGIYIYHILLRALLLLVWPHIFATPAGACILVTLSLGVAAASFHFIETPILALKGRFAPTTRGITTA